MFYLDKHNDHLHSVVNNMKFNSFNVETYIYNSLELIMLWRNKAQPNSFVRMHYNPYDNVAVQTYCNLR